MRCNSCRRTDAHKSTCHICKYTRALTCFRCLCDRHVAIAALPAFTRTYMHICAYLYIVACIELAKCSTPLDQYIVDWLAFLYFRQCASMRSFWWSFELKQLTITCLYEYKIAVAITQHRPAQTRTDPHRPTSPYLGARWSH